MSGNIFGEDFIIFTWGESHGKALGAVIEGIRPGVDISIDMIRQELERRRPGQSEVVTQRMESDNCDMLSGIVDGKTTGMPISLIVWNHDQDSTKYENLKEVFRPGHADYSYYYKYGIRDHRGGGRSSGRETVARVMGGAIARSLLKKKGISIKGYVKEIAGIKAKRMDMEEIEKNPIKCPDKMAAQEMIKKIVSAQKKGDSVGGIVEVKVTGVPRGLGDPVFDKLDANLAKAVFSIGSVKGFEIGAGFVAAEKLGSENNDYIGVDGFKSNNSGGILGGISNGQDIIIRAAIKPTPSISKTQETVNTVGKPQEIQIEGRHDPCICPRIVPVIESMVAVVLADSMIRQSEIKEKDLDKAHLRYYIDRVDSTLLGVLARRYNLSRKIGLYKKKYNLSIEDSKREEEILMRKKELAGDLGLDESFVEKLWKLMMLESKKVQRQENGLNETSDEQEDKSDNQIDNNTNEKEEDEVQDDTGNVREETKGEVKTEEDNDENKDN